MRHVYVYTTVYTARPCTSRVHGPYTAVYTGCVRGAGRLHGRVHGCRVDGRVLGRVTHVTYYRLILYCIYFGASWTCRFFGYNFPKPEPIWMKSGI